MQIHYLYIITPVIALRAGCRLPALASIIKLAGKTTTMYIDPSKRVSLV